MNDIAYAKAENEAHYAALQAVGVLKHVTICSELPDWLRTSAKEIVDKWTTANAAQQAACDELA